MLGPLASCGLVVMVTDPSSLEQAYLRLILAAAAAAAAAAVASVASAIVAKAQFLRPGVHACAGNVPQPGLPPAHPLQLGAARSTTLTAVP
mgnify:CR=1 FL=1